MMEFRNRLSRPSRGTLTLLGIVGVFLVIYAGIAMLRYQEQQDAEVVLEQIEQLTLLQRQPQNLSLLEQESKATRDLIPVKLQETDVYRTMRRIAARSDVVILKNSVSSPGTVKIGSTTYTLLNFQLAARGTYEDLRAFVQDMETQTEMATLVLENIGVERGEPLSQISVDYAIYVNPTG